MEIKIKTNESMKTNRRYREHTLELELVANVNEISFAKLPDFITGRVIDNIAVVDTLNQPSITGRSVVGGDSANASGSYLRISDNNGVIVQEGYVTGYVSKPATGNHFVNRGVELNSMIEKNRSVLILSSAMKTLLATNPTANYSILIRVGFYENI